MKVTPEPGCASCNGAGIVVDYVDWGSTTVPLESYCDCVTDQVPEDEEIEIVSSADLDDPFESEDYEVVGSMYPLYVFVTGYTGLAGTG